MYKEKDKGSKKNTNKTVILMECKKKDVSKTTPRNEKEKVKYKRIMRGKKKKR